MFAQQADLPTKTSPQTLLLAFKNLFYSLIYKLKFVIYEMSETAYTKFISISCGKHPFVGVWDVSPCG